MQLAAAAPQGSLGNMVLPGGGRGDTTGCNEPATVADIAKPGDRMSPSLIEGALWERTVSDRGPSQASISALL